MTDTDRTVHGEDEIDLNDDDDFDSSSSPSGMNDIPSASDLSPVGGSEGNYFPNHLDKEVTLNATTNGNGANNSLPSPTEPYHPQDEPKLKQTVSPPKITYKP